MISPLKVGDTVKNKVFGKGTVLSVGGETALVDFLNFGRKTISRSYLEVCQSPSEFFDFGVDLISGISFLDIVEALVDYMQSKKMYEMRVNDCVRTVQTLLSEEIISSFIIEAIEPVFTTVILKNLLSRKNFLITNPRENKIFTQEQEKQEFDFPIISDLSDFERSCIKEKFWTTVTLFFGREIIHWAENLKNVAPINRLTLKEMSGRILQVFLRQMSIGYFYNSNGSDKTNPDFYGKIYSYIQDNELSKTQKEDSLRLIGYYLATFVISQFRVVGGKKSNQMYVIGKNNDMYFPQSFINLIKADKGSLDRRIANRIKYFLSKNNKPSSKLQHYLDFFDSNAGSKDFILKFQYESELSKLKKMLNEEILLKDDFIELMKKFNIPTDQNNFDLCMSRIDYTVRSKKLILSNKYKSITSYYRTKILEDDVYRYSNPFNLDEYDLILKTLLNELAIIEVSPGLYLTKTNMERNGIFAEDIQDFQDFVLYFVEKNKFTSLQKIMDEIGSDKVVEYCDGVKRQLIQFIKPISEIGINELSSGQYILSKKSSKDYKGGFISFVFNDMSSIDIYDFKDLIKEKYDIDYSIDEIVRDLKHTTLYYSEEMEKIYRDKLEFIKEVFENGD